MLVLSLLRPDPSRRAGGSHGGGRRGCAGRVVRDLCSARGTPRDSEAVSSLRTGVHHLELERMCATLFVRLLARSQCRGTTRTRSGAHPGSSCRQVFAAPGAGACVRRVRVFARERQEYGKILLYGL